MTVLSANPGTHDNLLPNRFRFQLQRSPNVDFWCQQVSLPGFSISPTAQPNPFVEIPKSGDHIKFDELGIQMIVDAELSNYLEIYVWLKSLGFPDDFTEYASLLQDPKILNSGITSEITVFLLNGAQQPRFRFVYHDAFPVSLGEMVMSSTDADLRRVTCNCAFVYTSFDVYRIT